MALLRVVGGTQGILGIQRPVGLLAAYRRLARRERQQVHALEVEVPEFGNGQPVVLLIRAAEQEGVNLVAGLDYEVAGDVDDRVALS